MGKDAIIKTGHGFITTTKRSSLMKKIKSKNTKPELLIRRKLWSLGYRYQIKTKLPGKPDIVFIGKKLAVFVDGDFWHGYKWEEKKLRIKANRDYWIKKIEGNINRDLANNKKLEDLGFTVLRFWENEINKDLASCIVKLTAQLNAK